MGKNKFCTMKLKKSRITMVYKYHNSDRQFMQTIYSIQYVIQLRICDQMVYPPLVQSLHYCTTSSITSVWNWYLSHLVQCIKYAFGTLSRRSLFKHSCSYSNKYKFHIKMQIVISVNVGIVDQYFNRFIAPFVKQ